MGWCSGFPLVVRWARWSRMAGMAAAPAFTGKLAQRNHSGSRRPGSFLPAASGSAAEPAAQLRFPALPYAPGDALGPKRQSGAFRLRSTISYPYLHSPRRPSCTYECCGILSVRRIWCSGSATWIRFLEFPQSGPNSDCGGEAVARGGVLGLGSNGHAAGHLDPE